MTLMLLCSTYRYDAWFIHNRNRNSHGAFCSLFNTGGRFVPIRLVFSTEINSAHNSGLPSTMSVFPRDFAFLPGRRDNDIRISIGRAGYIFNTPYRWGRPVEHEWVDVGEPWSTHWTSVVLDRDQGDPLNLNIHSFFVEEPPELLPINFVAVPVEDMPGYWKCPRMGLKYYFAANVRVLGSDEFQKCWFELSDEEEERLWDRHMYNEMIYDPSRYE